MDDKDLLQLKQLIKNITDLKKHDYDKFIFIKNYLQLYNKNNKSKIL